MKKVLFYFLYSFLNILIVGFVLIKSVKNNPIKIQNSILNNKINNAILPEGWAFFTRDPRESQLVICNVLEKNKLKQLTLRNTDNFRMLGFSRENRVLYAKLSIALGIIDKKYWKYSEDDDLVLDSMSILTFKVKKPSLIGKYLIKIQKPLPWVWFSKINKKVSLPTNSLIINFVEIR